jgi:hypothetical protein
MTSTKVANKPAAAGVASPAAVMVVWAAGELGLVVPPEVAAAFVALLVTIAYWLAPARE